MNMSWRVFKLYSEQDVVTEIFFHNVECALLQKLMLKEKLCFLRFACHLMMHCICIKLHKNVLNGSSYEADKVSWRADNHTDIWADRILWQKQYDSSPWMESSIIKPLFAVFFILMLFPFPKVLWLAMDLLLYQVPSMAIIHSGRPCWMTSQRANVFAPRKMAPSIVLPLFALLALPLPYVLKGGQWPYSPWPSIKLDTYRVTREWNVGTKEDINEKP